MFKLLRLLGVMVGAGTVAILLARLWRGESDAAEADAEPESTPDPEPEPEAAPEIATGPQTQPQGPAEEDLSTDEDLPTEPGEDSGRQALEGASLQNTASEGAAIVDDPVPADLSRAVIPSTELASEATQQEVEGVLFASPTATLALLNNADATELRAAGLTAAATKVVLSERPFATLQAFADTRGIGAKSLQVVAALH